MSESDQQQQAQAGEEKPARTLALVANDGAHPLVPEIVRRYASGESLRELGREFGVSRMSIYRWMLGGLGDKQYHALVTDCLINRVAEADEELDCARDACDIARAREKARYARMDLERRRPQLYGAKPEVLMPATIVVLTRME